MPRLSVSSSEAILVLLSVLAGSSLAGAMQGPWLWCAGLAGALVVLAVTVATRRLGLLTTEWLGVCIGVMLLAGCLVVGASTGLIVDVGFFGGLVGGWADLLSSVPPVNASGPLLALPFALSWGAAMMGFALLRSKDRLLRQPHRSPWGTIVTAPISPALGPTLAFALGLLFSVELRSLALVQGAFLVVLSLLLGWVTQREQGLVSDDEIGNTTVLRQRARALYGATFLAIAAIAAPLVAPLAPGMAERERFDLRDRLDPPWNPLDEPSPLAQIKANYLDANRDDVVFVARGETVPRRWALATLASFDGTVWSVGDSEIGGEAPFVPIDELVPADPSATVNPAAPVSVEVEIHALDGPWLPLPGRAETLSVSQSTGEVGAVRFNQRTGTAAVPGGVAGAEVAVTARPTASLSSTQLAGLTLVPGDDLGLAQQASAVRNWAADQVEGVDGGWPQVAIIQQALQQGGYLADERSLPGHSWARLADFFSNEAFYGNEEQYAAVAGIAVRNAGLRARVVVGYLIAPEKLGSPEIEVTRDEASAWIEVLTVEHGWIPVDVTPDRDSEPTFTDPGLRIEEYASPNPPPPPPSPLLQAEVTPPCPPEECECDPEGCDPPVISTVSTLGIVIASLSIPAVPLLLGGAWLTAIGGLKWRRRRRRRRASDPGRSVAGAWYEVSDRLREIGAEVDLNHSVHQQARSHEAAYPGARGMVRLADMVDEAAFSAAAIGPSTAEEAWVHCNAIAAALRTGARRRSRLRWLADPSALLRQDPVS